MPRPLLAALLVLPLLACGGPEAPGEVVRLGGKTYVQVGNDPHQDVAESIPSFGGAYSENGTMVILLVDGASREEKDAARTWGDRLAGSHRGVTFGHADYTWMQLIDAKALAFPVIDLEGVNHLSLDPRTNRVLVGVLDPEAGARARAFLDETGLDPQLFRIARMEPVTFL